MRMSERQIQELNRAFVALDTNQDGVLSLAELRAGMGKGVVSRELLRIFKEVDTDCDGELQYTEFLAAALGARRYLQRDMAWVAFQRFDQDGDGHITAEELRAVLGGPEGEALGAGIL